MPDSASRPSHRRTAGVRGAANVSGVRTTTTPAIAQPEWLAAANRYEAMVIGLWSAGRDMRPLWQQILADPTLADIPRLMLAEVTEPPGPAELWLTRPIKRNDLLTRLDQLWTTDRPVEDNHVSVSVVASSASTEETQRLRVLLAEDNPINQKVAALQLEKLGYEVDIVSDGAAAVEAYKASSERFALILMDCQMPIQDGFQATRAIRAWEATEAGGRHIAVIAMTANAMAEDRAECLAAGMDDFLSKPVNRQALNEMLKRFRPLASA